jgi:transposase
MSATRKIDSNTRQGVLYMALELGEGQWKLAFTVGLGQKPRQRVVAARGGTALLAEIAAAKKRFSLSAESVTVSCYEAGREGFWLHRFLHAAGVENVVVDSSSIQIDRRRRRAKTDRLDAEKLVTQLVRWHQGEDKVWSVVRVPSVEEEDARQLHRELEALRAERTRHTNRIKGLLAFCGVRVAVDRHFPRRLKEVRMWDGSPLPPDLHRRLLREFVRIEVVNRQER